jgi:hypothetical protein
MTRRTGQRSALIVARLPGRQGRGWRPYQEGRMALDRRARLVLGILGTLRLGGLSLRSLGLRPRPRLVLGSGRHLGAGLGDLAPRRRADRLGSDRSRPRGICDRRPEALRSPCDRKLGFRGRSELRRSDSRTIRSADPANRGHARRAGTQPELSKILGGKFTEVSLERLMRFLTALGYHIEIKIGAGRTSRAGEVTVRDSRRTAA